MNGEGIVVDEKSERGVPVALIDGAISLREPFFGYSVIGARVICPKETGQIFELRTGGFSLKPAPKGCLSVEHGTCLPCSMPLSILTGYRDSGALLTQFYVRKSISGHRPSLMGQAFWENIGAALVPYNLEDRRRLPGYDTLRTQLEFHASRIVSKENPSEGRTKKQNTRSK